MDCVQMMRTVRDIVNATADDNRVVPPWPRGRWTREQRGIAERVPGSSRRGAASSWSVLIEYEDSGGWLSHRRITMIREEARCGGHAAIAAFCHEAGEPRVFRLDRIRSMADIETGELIDPHGHVESLRAAGLPFINRGMATFAKVLVFVARCDGHDHPAEWVAIEEALARYAVRMGGGDADIEDALQRCRRIAPDHVDFRNALCAIAKTPVDYRRQVARLAIESCAAIVDADERLACEEISWGSAIGRAMKIVAA